MSKERLTGSIAVGKKSAIGKKSGKPNDTKRVSNRLLFVVEGLQVAGNDRRTLYVKYRGTRS